jgi:hypothetical protein
MGLVAAILIALPAPSGAELQVLVSIATCSLVAEVPQCSRSRRKTSSGLLRCNFGHVGGVAPPWESAHRSGGALRGGVAKCGMISVAKRLRLSRPRAPPPEPPPLMRM